MKASLEEVTGTATYQRDGTSGDDIKVATNQFPTEIATRAPATGVTCTPPKQGDSPNEDNSEVRLSSVPLEDIEEAGAEMGDGHPFWALLYQGRYRQW